MTMMRNNGEKHDAGRGQWALLQQQNTNKQNQTNKGRKAQHVKKQGRHSTHRWIGNRSAALCMVVNRFSLNGKETMVTAVG